MTVIDLDLVTLAREERNPRSAVGRRVGFALGLMVFIAVVVFLGREGYEDAAGGSLTFLDALYYASVTVTTTGYGDISAVTPSTRLAALVLITPARILFLILVVGTTVEVLTEQYRRLLLTRHWRRTVTDHTIICGYGSTGRSATDALLANGVDPSDIVVVDTREGVVEEAALAGFTAVQGDASRVVVLEQAAISKARSVVVTPNRDDTAVLVTLTARELNPEAHIVVTVQERENVHLLEQGGADAVIDRSAAVGRLLGLAVRTPKALTVIDDLLDTGSSLEIAEVTPGTAPDGQLVVPAGVSAIEVIRDGQRLLFGDVAGDLRVDDRLIVARPSVNS